MSTSISVKIHLGMAAILLAGMGAICLGEDIKGWVVPDDAKTVKNPLAATPEALAAMGDHADCRNL